MSTQRSQKELLICGVGCYRAKGMTKKSQKPSPCYAGSSQGIEVVYGSTCGWNFRQGQIDVGTKLEVTVQSQPLSTPIIEKESRPYTDPHSPGYSPFKKGGDNPNPNIRY